MGPEKRICRLCLQIIGEDVPYSAFTNNAKALRNLEHISIITVKNLGLTDEPLICKLCDNKLEELSNFKETAVANESKIQSNHKTDFKAFLKTLSEDAESICRVCLKSLENKDELQKSWKDSEGLFLQCGIQMDENITVPAKICDGCHATLQNMTDFISLCSKNEKFIEELAAEKEKLTANDLITAFSSKNNTDIKNQNSKLRSAKTKANGSPQIKQPAKTKRNSGVAKIKNKKLGPSSNNAKEPKPSSAKQNSITEYLIKNCNGGDPQDTTSSVTKAQKTYKNKKNTSKKLYSLELPSTSKAGMPATDSIERELTLKHMNEQMEQMHISIDATPVSNLLDITLSVDEEGLVHEEVPSECNVTQELIDVLEGRLNNKEPSYATEGSSRGFKAELVDDVGIQDNSCYKEVMITIEPESKSKKGKGGKSVKNAPVGQVNNHLDVTKNPVRKTYSKTSKNMSTNHSSQNTTNRKVNNIEIRSVHKKTTTATEILESPISIKEENVPDAKQQTIVASFNMKLLKNNKKTSNQTADQNMLLASAEKTGNTIDEQNNTSKISTKKVFRVMRKVNNKIFKESSTDNGPPKKRSKQTDTSRTKSSIEIIPLPPNDASVVQEENRNHSSDDDEFVEEDLDKLENRSVTVTIIKGKKRTNKAQLDKSWQELTGKSATRGRPSASNMVPGLEIAVVKKRRGRPPLPDHLKKDKSKPTIVWLHCEQCPFKTYTQNSFIQHQLIHNVMSTVQTFHCDSCRFTTSNAELMQQHKATHESIHLIYKCVFCDEIFKKKISCMYHTLRHDDQDVASQFYCLVYNGVTEEEHFECYQCDHQSVEESTMPDHVIDHSVQKPKNPIVAKFKCNLCQYRTKSEDLLKRHKDLHACKSAKNSQLEIKGETKLLIKMEPGTENDEPPFLKCDQCHYMTRNKRSMANHKGLKHNRRIHPVVQGKQAATKAAQEDSPMYYCNECSYSTHRKLNLPRHALVHRTKENMEFFECPHCLFETKHRRSYTRHMESIHAVIV